MSLKKKLATAFLMFTDFKIQLGRLNCETSAYNTLKTTHSKPDISSCRIDLVSIIALHDISNLYETKGI